MKTINCWVCKSCVSIIFGLLCFGCKDKSIDHRFLLSSEGSGRATAYLESPKIISFQGKTHVAWLDTPQEGFRIRIRTLDQRSGKWSDAYTIGEATDNHGGPALTVDGEGYLHVLFYSHHHPFRYRRSVRPNDASEWTSFEEFGVNLTYPALVCAKDGTLMMTARRSYEDRPWELEMWSKKPGESWRRRGALLRSRYGNYSQFAASLAWDPDHTTLHLGARIYETPDDEASVPFTTVGYLSSPDGGTTWTRSDGAAVDLPATADTFDAIASGRAKEGRVLNAGSIGLDKNGRPFVPYSIRTQDTSQTYLASPIGNGKWRHLLMNQFLPKEYREWDVFMHGGVSFGSSGQPTVAATMMHISVDGIDWGEVTTELIRFQSQDGGETFTGEVFDAPSSLEPRWMPNLERPTGFNEMPSEPALIYTDGVRGEALGDQLSNRVWWLPGKE
jgi:hypothetical protein